MEDDATNKESAKERDEGPLYDGKRRVGRPSIYHFHRLQVGDDLLFMNSERHEARGAAHAYKLRQAKKGIVWNYRSEKHTDGERIRIWRTA